MRDKYDIIVIGSGIGGLVSAALLPDSGKNILVIEKEPNPGGYLTEFKSGEFAFDVSLHLLNGCGAGQYTHNIFSRCGIIDNITFLKPRYLYRSIFPDFDIKVPQMNVEAYKDMLIRLFPSSRNGIEGLFDDMSMVSRAVNDSLITGRAKTVLLPYISGSYNSVIDKYIKDQKLKAVICQLWIYFGLPPSMLRAIDFSYPFFDYLDKGGYYVERGSYEIVRALVKRIRDCGGDFLFNKSVGRVSIEEDSCQRVSFGKEEIPCDTIISNIDISKTVHELIGNRRFLADSITKFDKIAPSISAFEVFLGLDVDLSEIYPDDYEIFVSSGYDLDEQYRDCINNNALTAPFVITINSNVNRFSAPKGKSVVTVIMLAGYRFWVVKSKGEYQDKKEIIADILINRVSKIIPEVKTHLKNKTVSTPVTFERYTNNSEGAIYGYSRTIGQKAEVRPNDIKNIKNLYFASAWARQGSGVAKVLRAADDVYRKISSCAPEKTLR